MIDRRLDVSGLEFSYPDKMLLHGLSFTLDAGEWLHVRGNNGAGKTTLLKVLSGVLRPEAGEIHYHGMNLKDDLVLYQQQMCYVGHKLGVSQRLTVREHCRLEVLSYLAPSLCLVDNAIKRFSLCGFEDVLCGMLSSGQKRRVALLRLILSQASLWILDEPLVALDKAGVDSLMGCFDEHLNKGGQIVMTSHQDIPLRGHICKEYCL